MAPVFVADAVVFCAMLGAGAASFSLLPWPQSVFGAVFGVLAFRIARADLSFMIVPNADLALLLAAGLANACLGTAGPGGWDRAVAGSNLADAASRMIVLGGSAYVLAVLYRLWRGRDGLGLGDVKLMAVAGVWLPLSSALNAITVAALIALAVTLPRAIRFGADPRTAVPFAAYLAPAFWLAWMAGAMGL